MVRNLKDGQTVWATRWACSKGIIVGEARFGGYARTFRIHRDNKQSVLAHRSDADLFDNEAAALADAEARRLKKVASLRKQLARLEALRFVPDGGV